MQNGPVFGPPCITRYPFIYVIRYERALICIMPRCREDGVNYETAR